MQQPNQHQPSPTQLQLWELTSQVFTLYEPAKRLLELWTQIYLYNPTIESSFNEGHVFWRSGQNSIIQGIYAAITEYNAYMKKQAASALQEKFVEPKKTPASASEKEAKKAEPKKDETKHD